MPSNTQGTLQKRINFLKIIIPEDLTSISGGK